MYSSRRQGRLKLPLAIYTSRCALVGICGTVRVTAASLCVVQQAAGTSMPSPSESAAPGLYGLSAVERYYFETQGFVVIPDIIPEKLLAELNAVSTFCAAVRQHARVLRAQRPSPAWLTTCACCAITTTWSWLTTRACCAITTTWSQAVDACADRITRTTAKLSGDVAALQGEFGRGDTGSFMEWPQPHCQPFRQLMTLPRMVRIMLDLVGPGFHLSSANGIVMDAGAEGQQMHGGQRSDGSNGRRDAWTYSIDRNGQIECNLINCMYQLSDIGPTDGGTLVVPASHKSFFNLPEEIRAITPAMERFDSQTGGSLLKTVPCRAGSALIFTEALSRKSHTLPFLYKCWIH